MFQYLLTDGPVIFLGAKEAMDEYDGIISRAISRWFMEVVCEIDRLLR
jgi:hypothetical protein